MCTPRWTARNHCRRRGARRHPRGCTGPRCRKPAIRAGPKWKASLSRPVTARRRCTSRSRVPRGAHAIAPRAPGFHPRQVCVARPRCSTSSSARSANGRPRGDWSGVRALLDRLRAGLATGTAGPGDSAASVTRTRTDPCQVGGPRRARLTGPPARCARRLRSMASPSQVDDEARALRAVAWLRSGDAGRGPSMPIATCSCEHRTTPASGSASRWRWSRVLRRPDAARFAYLQTLELAQDEAVRAVARARLAPPQA